MHFCWEVPSRNLTPYNYKWVFGNQFQQFICKPHFVKIKVEMKSNSMKTNDRLSIYNRQMSFFIIITYRTTVRGQRGSLSIIWWQITSIQYKGNFCGTGIIYKHLIILSKITEAWDAITIAIYKRAYYY